MKTTLQYTNLIQHAPITVNVRYMNTPPGNPTETTTDPTSEMVASIKANIESLQARIKANKDKMWLIKVEVAGLEKSVKLAQAMIETITKGPES